jgi:predicted Zn-dependent protease
MNKNKFHLHIFFIYLFLTSFYNKSYAEKNKQVLVPIVIDIKNETFGYLIDKSMTSLHITLNNDQVQNQINALGKKLVDASGGSNIPLNFRIFNNTVINAYAGAGGIIYINTGLLDFVQSIDELAGIIAHEIGHVACNHGAKNIENQYKKSSISSDIGFWTGIALASSSGMLLEQSTTSLYNSTTSNLAKNTISTLYPQLTSSCMQAGWVIGGVIGKTIGQSLTQGYSKEFEFEADAYAVHLLKKANMDPYGLIHFFNRLKNYRDIIKDYQEGYQSNLMNSKPGIEARITHINELLK